jgi:hypothetical protein
MIIIQMTMYLEVLAVLAKVKAEQPVSTEDTGSFGHA